ncbi:uncharacterized protein LOC117181082 [Belonocnema kinseyi]|uniref:uncharacterized protein LOC117181082 n=1 Tax=Belonocnema kinseyi TaxID=2817044 RepID=UPI00143CEAE7|nr:uncharacterized protein LOC117181082 [Belonocnema kinseyi]
MTKIVIREEDIKMMYGGTQATLNALHRDFWIVNGRNIVKNVIHKCVTCARAKPATPQYPMGNFPKSCLSLNRAFLASGIDYCGPFFIKEKRPWNRRKVNMCAAILACLATKAIYIELVSDLTTEALTEKNIACHFIPSRSPHFGRLWEATEKSFKHHMLRVIGDKLLQFDELLTFAIEVEEILNSRPINPILSDPNDLAALTPGHFLINDSFTRMPEQKLKEIT